MARRSAEPLDTELADLPPEARWREWMGRVEAVIFAAPTPVWRDVLARLVGRDCNLELLIDDIRTELRGRPYELVAVAGGWQHRTRPSFAAAIRAAFGGGLEKPLSPAETLVLTAIAYFQPITRAGLGEILGKAVGRDTIGDLRALGFVAAGPRSPEPGAPYTYVTTTAFLAHFGFGSLRDLPDVAALEEAGLLGKERLLAGHLMPLGRGDDDAEDAADAGEP